MSRDLEFDLFEATDEEEAQRHLLEIGVTDGLPVIIPTERRVDEMIRATRLPRQHLLGVVEPGMGAATVGRVAVNAVMAGCRPEHFGVVCAAVRAVCEPDFNLGVVQGTTNNATPLLIVSNGPADIASGTGALGPGNQANATIGRALRLVLMNVGGGRPGVGDMATLGQPAKFTCVVGEGETVGAFGPLSAQPVVTVMAVEGPCQIMFVPVGDAPGADAARLVELLVRTLLTPGSLGAMGYGCAATVLLAPLHADILSDAGHTRASLQQAMFDLAVVSAGEIRRLHGIVRGNPTIADREMVHGLVSPDHVVIAVAGGAGTYSVVMRGLANTIGNAVTASIEATK